MTARHRLLPVFATALFASLTLSVSTAHAADCTGANLLPALASVPSVKAATLCLINGERGSRGLLPLAEEPVLEDAAQSYSQAMVKGRFFDHVSPDGQTIEDRLAAYTGSATSWVTGENIAWGEGPLATPASIVKSWMASPGHRENILDADFSEAGIGIAGGSSLASLVSLAATYTAEFGSHASAAAQPAELRASASATSPRPVDRPVSAKTKRQISERCHKVAKRTKVSKKIRAARYDRCVSKAMRAAAR